MRPFALASSSRGSLAGWGVGRAPPVVGGWARVKVRPEDRRYADCGALSQMGGGMNGGEPLFVQGCGCGGSCGDDDQGDVHYRMNPPGGGDGATGGRFDDEDDGRIDEPFPFGEVPGPDDMPRDPGGGRSLPDFGFAPPTSVRTEGGPTPGPGADLPTGPVFGFQPTATIPGVQATRAGPSAEPSTGVPGIRTALESCFPTLMALVDPAGQGEFDPIATPVPAGDPTGFTPEPSAFAIRVYDPNQTEPYTARLLLAVSPDGHRWTKTGEVVCNHGAVPCLAVEGDTLYLFFNVRRIGVRGESGYMAEDTDRSTPLAVAWTRDLVTWTYRLIGDEGSGFTYDDGTRGLEAVLQAMDPSVVRTIAPEGDAASDRWFLYFTLEDPDDAERRPATYVAGAASLASMDWQQRNSGGEVFPQDLEEKSRDPNVRRLGPAAGGGHYQFFAGGNHANVNWSAQLDANGIDILDKEELLDATGSSETLCGGDPVMMCNPQDPVGRSGGSQTWYAFANVDPGA